MTRRFATAIFASLALLGCGTSEAPAAADTSVPGAAATGSDANAPVYEAGALTIHNVVAPAPVATGDGAPPMAVYFLVMNAGAEADTLDGVDVVSGSASLHQQTGTSSGRQVMAPLTSAAVPAGEMLRLVPGGRHVMVEGMTGPVAVGDAVPLTLVFRRAGRVPVSARVVAYGDLERVIGAGADEHAGH